MSATAGAHRRRPCAKVYRSGSTGGAAGVRCSAGVGQIMLVSSREDIRVEIGNDSTRNIDERVAGCTACVNVAGQQCRGATS